MKWVVVGTSFDGWHHARAAARPGACSHGCLLPFFGARPIIAFGFLFVINGFVDRVRSVVKTGISGMTVATLLTCPSFSPRTHEIRTL